MSCSRCSGYCCYFQFKVGVCMTTCTGTFLATYDFFHHDAIYRRFFSYVIRHIPQFL